MVAAAAVQADAPALIAAGFAALAVLVGNVFRPTATLAVLLAAAVLVLNEARPCSPRCPDCARGYLVLRHTVRSPRRQSLAPWGLQRWAWRRCRCRSAAVGTAVAPLAVLARYVLVTRPFWAT